MAKTNLQKTLASALLGASLVGLTGCATTASANGGGKQVYINEENYPEAFRRARMKKYEESFKDSYNGKRIIGLDNDLYVENLDGSGRYKITNSPNTKETWACFTKDTNYIFFRTTSDDFRTDEYFLKKIGSNLGDERKIEDTEYRVYFNERFGKIIIS